MNQPQFQDPKCRAANTDRHYCHDKYGAPYASDARPARPGSTCWYESMMQLEDERIVEQAELDALRSQIRPIRFEDRRQVMPRAVGE